MWKAAVEDPEKLIFTVSHYNVIDYILEYGKISSYEEDLLTNMVNGLKDVTIINKLLHRVDPINVRNLITIIEQLNIQGSRPLVETLGFLFNSLNSDNFIEVTRELVKESITTGNNEDVGILISHLVRMLLTRYSVKYLNKSPEKTFTKTFLSSFREIIIEKSLDTNDIRSEISLVLNDLKGLMTDQSKSFNTTPRNEFFEGLFHNNNYWFKDRYNITTNIKKTIRRSAIPTDVKDNLVLEIAQRICYVFLREIMYEYTPAGNKVEEILNKHYFHNLSALCINLIYDREYDRNKYQSSFQHSFSSKSLSVFLDLLSKSMSKLLPLHLVASKLEILIDNQKSSGQSIDSFDFTLSCYQLIESIAENMLDSVMAQVQSIRDIPFDHKGFLELLFEYSVNDLTSHGMSFLPASITLSQYHHITDSLFDKLLAPIKNWKVFFEIGNLDLDGRSLDEDNVVLYDARKWDMGERFEWDMRAELVDEKGTKMRSQFREYGSGYFKSFGSSDLSKVIFKRSSARAMIKVSAYDQFMAASEARRRLNKSLNVMVYEFTNQARLKHHPLITRSYEVVRDDDSVSHYEVNYDHFDILKISQREQKILESYQNPDLTSKEDRLYRALAWFNSAFWESDSYAKYVLYWIGLEQLLDLGSVPKKKKREASKDILVRIIPNVTVTWRDDGHSNYVINNHLDEIIRAISGTSELIDKLENGGQFKDWRQKDFVILENLSILEELVRGTNIEQSVKMLGSWILENILGIEARTAYNRKRREFDIAYMYARRNTLVHEGSILEGDLEHFVNRLQKLLTRVISVTRLFPLEQDWVSVSREYNRPFSASFDLDDPTYLLLTNYFRANPNKLSELIQSISRAL